MTYYIVWERPEGSRCWTIAAPKDVPIYFCMRSHAVDFVDAMKDIADEVHYHISKVKLPK